MTQAKDMAQPKQSCKDYYIQQGRREVVEWLDVFERDCYCDISNHIPYEDWQAKLKEWGV